MQRKKQCTQFWRRTQKTYSKKATYLFYFFKVERLVATRAKRPLPVDPIAGRLYLECPRLYVPSRLSGSSRLSGPYIRSTHDCTSTYIGASEIQICEGGEEEHPKINLQACGKKQYAICQKCNRTYLGMRLVSPKTISHSYPKRLWAKQTLLSEVY